MQNKICELWLRIAEAIAVKYGAPLPNGLLILGVPGQSWNLSFNNTDDTLERLPAMAVSVSWNDWPAGIVTPIGGTLAACEAANEATFRAWLKEFPQPAAEANA